MNSNHLVYCILLVTLKVVTSYFDTSYYQILSEGRGEDFNYFSGRCIGSIKCSSYNLTQNFNTNTLTKYFL